MSFFLRLAGVSSLALALFLPLSGHCVCSSTRCQPYAPSCEAQVAETLLPKARGEESFSFKEGTSLRLALMAPLSSETSFEGQPFEARVATPLYDGEKLLLSSNDLITGHVVRAESAVQGRGGRLSLMVDQLKLDTGLTYDLDASVLYFQEKAFFGGDGTEGTVPVVFKYRIQNFPRVGNFKLDYNRYRLLGAKQPGEPYNLQPGDMLVMRLNKPLSVYRF